MKNKSWIVRYPTTEEIVEVIIDPDQELPDGDTRNNKWINN